MTKHGFNVPQAVGGAMLKEIWDCIGKFKWPLIVKPMDVPKSEVLANHILCLPLYYNLPKETVVKIAEIVTNKR